MGVANELNELNEANELNEVNELNELNELDNTDEIFGEISFKRRKEYKCEKCKDTGYLIVKAKVIKCKECEKKKNILNINISEEKILKMQEDIIPEKFRDMTFDTAKIEKDSRISTEIRKAGMFNNYLDTLKNIYNAINTNVDLKYSILITAPQGLGKTSLVYSCLNAAIRNGKTVAPYLDSLEINSLLLKDDVDIINKLVNSDVCFIKIPTTNSIGAMRSLTIIIDRRSRKGLPTIVTSRYDINYLYSIDYNLDKLFITNNFGENPYDYARMRVVSSPYENFREHKNKYSKKN